MTAGSADDFAEMALSLHEESTFDDTVERVLEFALKAVDCTYAGVVFEDRHSGMETIAATHPVVTGLDRVQAELGGGPSTNIDSGRFSEIIADTHTETRWPRWAAAAAHADIRSMLGSRLYTSASTIGTLNLYDEQPDHFNATDREVAHVLARHTAIALDSKRDSENLWRAIDARKIIGQAQGILMGKYDLTADHAFAVLRRYSQDNNIKLYDVALKLIETRLLPLRDPANDRVGPLLSGWSQDSAEPERLGPLARQCAARVPQAMKPGESQTSKAFGRNPRQVRQQTWRHGTTALRDGSWPASAPLPDTAHLVDRSRVRIGQIGRASDRCQARKT